MEKVDLLVHIQKIQLELDQTKAKLNTDDDSDQQKDDYSRQLKEQERLISKLRDDLHSKDLECKKWMTKIEQANDLTEDFEVKVQKVEESLRYEKSQKEHFQALFQELSSKESQRNVTSTELAKLKVELSRKDDEIHSLKAKKRSEELTILNENEMLRKKLSDKDMTLRELTENVEEITKEISRKSEM